MNPNKALFNEINEHLLNDKQPSLYFNEVSQHKIFSEHPFNQLNRFKETEQPPQHHPEGNVWNHTMLVVDEAAKVKGKSKDQRVFMWAALLHDIGKPDATRHKKGKITAYDHDKIGEKLARDFLLAFVEDQNFIESVVALVRWHMQILFVANNLQFADIKTMKKQVDVNEVALLGLCDRLGRTNVDKAKEENNIRVFLQKCSQE